MDPVTGLTKTEARALIRDGRRAGILQDEVLATALRLEAYELAAVILEEYRAELEFHDRLEERK